MCVCKIKIYTIQITRYLGKNFFFYIRQIEFKK